MDEPQRRPVPGSGLHQCAVCRADFMVPIVAEVLDEDQRRLLLRCGECQTYRDVVVGVAAADRYEQAWERGVEAVAAEYRRVARERMASDVEALICALERDLIDAADFARGA